jgi:serine/threonine-protein kinase
MRIVLPDGLRRSAKKAAIALAWLFVGGVIVGGTFAGAFLLAMKSEMRSTEVTVPDLRTLSLEQAAGISGPLELRLEVVDRRHDAAVPSGGVLQQDPAPGSSVRRGRKVKLVVSQGGRVLEVPDVTGRPARTVKIELAREGFAPGDEARVHSPTVPVDRVVAQVPAAGSPTVPNARIHRLVSDGERDPAWVMPDLTGLSRAAAERWIELCGLRAGRVRRVPARGRPEGSVVGQLPLAGYPVRTREVVELSVAD